MMFLFLGTSFADNGIWDVFHKNQSRNMKYRSAKFKSKMHKRSQRKYKKACKYHNHYKEFLNKNKNNHGYY